MPPQFQRYPFCFSMGTLMVVKEYVAIKEPAGVFKGRNLRAVSAFRFKDREKFLARALS